MVLCPKSTATINSYRKYIERGGKLSKEDYNSLINSVMDIQNLYRTDFNDSHFYQWCKNKWMTENNTTDEFEWLKYYEIHGRTSKELDEYLSSTNE